MRKRCIFYLACLVVLFGVGLPATTQEQPAKEEHPSVVARKMLKDVRVKLFPNKSSKDALRSIAILDEITDQMCSMQVEFNLLFLDRDPMVRRQAAIMLGEVSRRVNFAPNGMKYLTDRLDIETDPEVIAGIYMGLARIGPYAKATVPRFIAALKHDDPRVRRAACGLFFAFQEPDEKIIPLAVKCLDDPDLGPDGRTGLNCVSMHAMRYFWTRRLPAKDAAPSLIRIYKSNRADEAFRLVALNALAIVAPENRLLIDTTREWLQSEDTDLLTRAVRLSGMLGSCATDIIPDLIALAKRKPINDPLHEQRLKLALLSAFRDLGPTAKEALPTLQMLPETNDFTLRRLRQEAIKAVQGIK